MGRGLHQSETGRHWQQAEWAAWLPEAAQEEGGEEEEEGKRGNCTNGANTTRNKGWLCCAGWGKLQNYTAEWAQAPCMTTKTLNTPLQCHGGRYEFALNRIAPEFGSELCAQPYRMA